jgi:hypothetical protein
MAKGNFIARASAEKKQRGEENDGAQRAEVVVDEETRHARGGDEEREAGRVGVVRGDVVVVQGEREEALVPIPHRVRDGQEAREGDEDRERDNDPFLAAAHRALHS